MQVLPKKVKRSVPINGVPGSATWPIRAGTDPCSRGCLSCGPGKSAKRDHRSLVSILIRAVVEMKQRNPDWGSPRIAQQIALAFHIQIDKDVVRRILARLRSVLSGRVSDGDSLSIASDPFACSRLGEAAN